MKKIFTLLLLLAATTLSYASIRYVKQGATGTAPYTTWATADGNLQTVINACSSGDSIFVAAGKYQPASGQSFSMKEGVKIYGGFAATGTPSFANRNLSLFIDSLVGNGNGVINNNFSSASPMSSASVLDGFTVTGGNTTGGGGMYNNYASPTVVNCIFSINNATRGGGIYNNQYSNATIVNCSFVSNTATWGAAIDNENNTTVNIKNVTIYGNTAITDGGGIRNIYNSSSTVANTIIWGNTAPDGASIDNQTGGNTAVTYSDVQSGYTGTGNINTDPLFVNAAGGAIYSYNPVAQPSM